MDENDAIEALENLGLSNYEAKVFTALQKLGTGTARDVHRVTDVPRSQVYGAAESLQGRGLLEVQQSKPIQYRPVSLEAARSHLRGEFERTQERAFDYLETAREEYSGGEEKQEDIWTVHGDASIDGRVEQLLEEAEDRVLVGFGRHSPLDGWLLDLLRERAESGVEVYLVTSDESFAERFEDGPIGVRKPPEPHVHDDEPIGRVIVVDGETVLLSVRGDLESAELDEETAIWSSQTGIAAVLIQLIESGLGESPSD